MLAVTGTNGKTTVTALTGQLVERAGKTVAVAGNIGPTLLDTLARQGRRRARCPRSGCSSCRASSWKPRGEFEPTAAAVLNVTQDHLDWHGTMDAYAAAKARVFGKAALMILNREDPRVMQMLPAAGAAQGRPHGAAPIRTASAPTCRGAPAISASRS